MANPRYNSQVTQPRGNQTRVGKMGGGMMMQRPMYKAGGRIKNTIKKGIKKFHESAKKATIKSLKEGKRNRGTIEPRIDKKAGGAIKKVKDFVLSGRKEGKRRARAAISGDADKGKGGYKAGGRIAGAARRAQQHGYYTPDMGMKGGKMYAKGGKVSGKKKIMAVGRGKAKDYPGIKKLIEMNKKGKKRFRDGGSALKQVKPSQKGLKKLPTKVRNKMGYMKKGGRVGEMMYSRGYGEGMKSKRKPTELMDRGAMKKGGRVHKNTRRMNRLEELGRVDAEKGRTRKGKRNLRDEKKRIVRELKR